jgi:serine/threonine protein kinase
MGVAQMNGNTLGHYRVGEQLGRGGMGEVYVADDLNLNRKVALKFLPDVFTGDPERMARFEREAKLLASLNHPNIVSIHGLEEAEGKRFLVLELVEGETLAQRLSKGCLSIDEALGICRMDRKDWLPNGLTLLPARPPEWDPSTSDKKHLC